MANAGASSGAPLLGPDLEWVGNPTVPQRMPSHLRDHEDDENADQEGYILGTDYSLPYSSQWSRIHAKESGPADILRHMNCSFMSAGSTAPTLIALKQHAQSLCVLIQMLNPTMTSAEIDPTRPTESRDAKGNRPAAAGADPLEARYKLGDAFDWLLDLNKTYHNDDAAHYKPLNELLNEVRTRSEMEGTAWHCPLEQHTPRGKKEVMRPWANHQMLMMHANQILERLDHEFSATGGILSMLPYQDDSKDDLKQARNSLLGQWLLYTQHLVARQHELEREKANLVDALQGQADKFRQHLSMLGPDGRSGSVVAYPQDRFVLCNAGDDVFDYLHQLMDRAEATKKAKVEAWKRNGVTTSVLWAQGYGGAEYERGIVPVTIATRYYRLAGQGKSTIFVVPAWGQRPDLTYTREIQEQPTLVACRAPLIPTRVSQLDERFATRLREAEVVEHDNMQLRGRNVALEKEVRVLRDQHERLQMASAGLLKNRGKKEVEMAADLEAAKKELMLHKKAIAALETAVGDKEAVIDENRNLLQAQLRELQGQRRKMAEIEAALKAAKPDAAG